MKARQENRKKEGVMEGFGGKIEFGAVWEVGSRESEVDKSGSLVLEACMLVS